MENERQKLKQIIKLGAEVAQVNDLDILLERILSTAREFVNADAGSIYIKNKEKNELKFSYTQNDTLNKGLPPGQKLIYTTFVMPINNQSIAGYVANTGNALNIPDVYQIKNEVPYSFDKSYDDITKYRSQSMLTVPLKNSRGEVVGVLQLINAQDKSGNVVPFSNRDGPFITYFANNAAIAIERAQITRMIILRMISMARLRDPKETGAHVNRVAGYAVEIYENWARRKGISQKEIDANRDSLRMAAMLHDVGKVAVSDTILKKPGRFTPEEYEIMKSHTFMGARLFANPSSVFDEAAAEVALNHHEYWNGCEKGYPGHIDFLTGEPLSGFENEDGTARRKKGEEIPVFGRVVAVADVYDALCSKRCYKEAWEESKALEIVEEEREKQFDPEMVDAFFSCLDMIHSIRNRYPDSNEEQIICPEELD